MGVQARRKKGQRYSIHQYIGPRGTTWRAIVDLSPDPQSGKRRQKRLTGYTTKRQLEEDIIELLGKDGRGELPPDEKLTVAIFLDHWLETIKETVKPTTYRNYRDYIRLWLAPQLGAIRLVKLMPVDVQRMTTAITDAGRSATTAQHAHGVLRTALGRAVAWGLIPRNVCTLVKAPRRTEPEIVAWSQSEANTFLTTAAGDALEALWWLAITTGMRRGELLGLRWQDVDLERKTVSIRHTLVRGDGGAFESSTPKTKKSRRTIAISDRVVTLLRKHQTEQKRQRLAASVWVETGLVFCNHEGKPLSVNRMEYHLKRLIRLAGVPAISVHGLRHTAATLMLASGEHPKIAQERLGHSTVAMTLDRYSHVTEGMQRDAAERLERLIEDAG